jgi:hypothetical protein
MENGVDFEHFALGIQCKAYNRATKIIIISYYAFRDR